MMYPEFEQAVSDIIQDITSQKDFLDAVREEPERKVLNMAHSNYGRYIRNSRNLWEDSTLTRELRDMGFTHADDMSSTLIKCAIRDIKGEPRDIQKEVQYYKKYWENAEKGIFPNMLILE